MRASVEIHELNTTSKQYEISKIVWDGERIFAVPDSSLLRGIIEERIIGNWKGEICYITKNEPEKFLTCLHHQYRSAYLNAKEAIVDNA